jgi:chorismate mutase/prephenate dehydratase
MTQRAVWNIAGIGDLSNGSIGYPRPNHHSLRIQVSMTIDPHQQDGTSSPSETIHDQIRRVDLELIEKIANRQQLVQQLLEQFPQQVGQRITTSSQRIEHLLNEFFLRSSAELSLSKETLGELLKHISSACILSHHPTNAAYLGPQHSYSHLAAIKYFGDSTPLRPVGTIRAVFESVARGDLPYGVVPIENSTDGRVVDTLGMFLHCEMKVCGEVLLPIHHNLLSRTPREEITEVHSKPQALSQCREWLSKHLPNASLVEISSTAAAAQLAANQHGVAAVASIEAGRQYELDVVDANIEDNPNNVTRFAVLGTDHPSPTGDDKTSLLFQLHHRPGALADAMSVFKNHSLNLTWIESFPAPESRSEYIFFVELAGHREQAEVTRALEDLERSAQRLTVLGSYPKAGPS